MCDKAARLYITRYISETLDPFVVYVYFWGAIQYILLYGKFKYMLHHTAWTVTIIYIFELLQILFYLVIYKKLPAFQNDNMKVEKLGCL